MLLLWLSQALAGPWVTLTPAVAGMADPTDGFAVRAGPLVDAAVGEDHGFELRARVLAAIDPDFDAEGIGIVEVAFRPRITENWRLGGQLAMDVDTMSCTGTSPPLCDGTAVSVTGRYGDPLWHDTEQVDFAVGAELSRALGDRMTLRPRARASIRHRTGLTAAADVALHLQTMWVRAEFGYTFTFGSRAAL